MAITGLSEIECEATVSKIETVGKKKIQENRRVACPIDTYDKKILERWLEENCQEPGWHLVTYLGGKESVVRDQGGNLFLNYRVAKYVEQPAKGATTSYLLNSSGISSCGSNPRKTNLDTRSTH